MCNINDIKQYFFQDGSSPSAEVAQFQNSVLEYGVDPDVPGEIAILVLQWAEADPGEIAGHLANEIISLCQAA